MKGITPVVAIILLLLITISMVGFAFVWFSRVTQSATEGIAGDINNTITISSQKVRIEAVASGGATVTMRASGSGALPANSVAVLVAGAIRNSTCPGTSQGSGSVFTCALSPACTGGQTVRATAPGNFDEVSC